MKEFKYDVIQLVEGVRDRPCLWDKTLENYKDRVERRAAWEQIFTMLDESYEVMVPEEKRITGELILNKWTNIRDTFMKTLKARVGRPRKKYLLYDNLKFLLKIVPEEDRADFNEDYYIKQEPEAHTSYKEDFGGNYTESPTEEYITKRKPKRDAFEELRKGNEVSSQKKKRKRQDDIKKKKPKVIEEVEDVRYDSDVESSGSDARLISDPRLMNEDEAFFASLLPSVVRYNEDERLQFRIEVLAVMSRIKEKRKSTRD